MGVQPIYLTDAHKGLLPGDTLLLTRRELGENVVAASLDFKDSYWLYSVSRTADTVALMSPAQFNGLPQAAREELLRLQWQLGRGQIYDSAFVEEVLGAVPPLLERTAFDTPAGRPACRPGWRRRPGSGSKRSTAP